MQKISTFFMLTAFAFTSSGCGTHSKSDSDRALSAEKWKAALAAEQQEIKAAGMKDFHLDKMKLGTPTSSPSEKNRNR